MTENAENTLNALVARVRKVRRWLVTLAILKVGALCLISVLAYIGVYAWLDHRLQFDSTGRIIAFILLVAMVALLLYCLTKLLLPHISCSGAANYIESRMNFHQQLVTAIEYYEKKQDYPYSRILADNLVLQVDRESQAFSFDSTIEKWRGYVFAAIILFGLGTVYFYVRSNYIYFSSYFVRLTRPLAAVEPLSPTSLESITKDIITTPDSVVTFAAEIKGRVPEFGKLVLVAGTESETADNSQKKASEEILQLQPSFDEEGKPKFEGSKSFEKLGQFRYRFEADTAFTDWHNISVCQLPEIKSMTAEVTLPGRLTRRQWSKPYTEQIEDHTLEVISGSQVKLTVETTANLNEASVTDLDGEVTSTQLKGTNQFTTRFVVYKEGYIKFHFVSADGVTNDKVPTVQVLKKIEEPPKLKLLSPDGDYLATDVASVPVTFEVTDDFGLSSVTMYVEMVGQKAQALTIPVETGAKSMKVTHTLELEERDLTVGDSILFYAKATDIDIGSTSTRQPSSSDMYFIEIRPYRQLWRREAGGGSSMGGVSSAKLLEILEYTRAILKKTWAIVNKADLTEQNRSGLDSINNDVQFCAAALERERDNPRNNFNDGDKATLNEILGYYERANKYLAKHDASSAIVPEKDAYRVLRKFIIELEKKISPPSSGSSPPIEKPDSIKLQEQPPLTDYEKERIKGELKQLTQKLGKVSTEQKNLKKTFEKFLTQQAEKKSSAQKTTDSQSLTGEGQGEGQGQGKGKGQGQDKGQGQGKGKGKGQGKGQGQGKGEGKGQGVGEGSGSGKRNIASAQERMKMLQAKQKALQEKVSQLKQSLQDLPEISQVGEAPGRQEAQKHLDEAMAQMDKFQAKLAEDSYKSAMDKIKSTKAVQALELADRELDMAGRTLESELTLNDEQMLAKDAQKLAEELTELADALDESVTPIEREQMLARLEAAKRLLEAMPKPQWMTVGKGAPGGAAHVLTTEPGGAPAKVARAVARQFWSIAINAKKRQRQLIEDEPSDVKFYELETEFFENAAKFKEAYSENKSQKGNSR